jgi:hypothetical protein
MSSPSGLPLLFTQAERRQLQDMSRFFNRHKKQEGGGNKLIEVPDTYQGAFLAKVVSEEGIPAASGPTVPGRGTVVFHQLWFVGDNTSQEDMELVGPTDKPVLFNNLPENSLEQTVYNTSETQEWIKNDIVLVVPLAHGRLVVVPSLASSPTRHAVVVSCLGNGYYTARLAVPHAWQLPSPIATGTGTGTGTSVTEGSGCNVCDSISFNGSGEYSASCGDMTQPQRESLEGYGDIIYCYDPRKLPLDALGHIIVANLGDYVDASEYEEAVVSTGTGTGTGTSSTLVVLWMVITGNYPLVGIPDRFYDCCPDGQPKLIRCDTYITEGVKCPGVDDPCPPPEE